MKQIAFVTDTHLDERLLFDRGVDPNKNRATIKADIKARNITDIIFGGDIGDATAHQYFFDALNDFSTRLILGNHDNFNQVSAFYNPHKNKEELYYSSEDDDNRFIFLDSSSEKISDKQLEWLQTMVASEKPLIVFIHHPVVEIQTAMDRLYPLKNRAAVKSILENAEKPVTIFCGHYHMNDERSHNNIRQIVTQAASYQIEKDTMFKLNDSIFGLSDHRNRKKYHRNKARNFF